jgi:DNA-binding beta-propeller fold protein YncE
MKRRFPPLARRVLLGLSVLGIAGCATRDHDNPLDPENPDTGGAPRWLSALADEGAVDLAWSVDPFRDLDAVRLVSTTSGAVLWTGDSGTASFRHPGLPEDVEQGYRLDLVLNDGRILQLPEEVATPGPDVPWIVDSGSGSAKRLTPDGRGVRVRVTAPAATGVVADPDSAIVLLIEFFEGRVRLLDREGAERWKIDTLLRPIAAARVPGGWWIADAGLGAVMLFSEGGTFVYGDSSFTFPADLAPAEDGGVWVADRNGPVARVVAGGGIAVAETLDAPLALAPADGGGVWVADRGDGSLVRLDAAAFEQARAEGYPGIESLTRDPATSGVWAADRAGHRVVLFDASVTESLSHGGFSAPAALAVSPDGQELWVADPGREGVVRLERDGTVLTRTAGVTAPVSIAITFR